MGCGKPSQFSTRTRTLGAMIDRAPKVCALCEGKWGAVQIDLVELAARVGRDYSLIGRRCRSRITPRAASETGSTIWAGLCCRVRWIAAGVGVRMFIPETTNYRRLRAAEIFSRRFQSLT
jgi:hypothetical protein